MKKFNLLKTTFIIISFIFIGQSGYSQEEKLDLQDLVGLWKLDMSPENKSDSNFAMMEITKIESNLVEGSFYREGVSIREGRTNTQLGRIYIALVSGDNSGEYNSSFYLENGKIYGTTHSIDRDFLAVWIGEKN
jgi:hypothetical protein